MRGILRNIFFAGCLGGMSVAAAAAQDAAQNEWNPASAGPVTTWTAPMCGKGQVAAQPFLIYTHMRGSFDSDGHYHARQDGEGREQFLEQLFLQYGVTDRFELDAQVACQQNRIEAGGRSARAQGIADTYLFARYCLAGEGWRGPQVTGLFQLCVPTGKYQHGGADEMGADLMGGGAWDPALGVILTQKLQPFILHADAVYSFSQSVRTDGVDTRAGDALNLDLAAEVFLPRGFNLMLEANGLIQGDEEEDGRTEPDSRVRSLTLCPGVGWSNDRVQTLLAYQRVVAGVNTDAADSVVLTCVYTF